MAQSAREAGFVGYRATEPGLVDHSAAVGDSARSGRQTQEAEFGRLMVLQNSRRMEAAAMDTPGYVAAAVVEDSRAVAADTAGIVAGAGAGNAAGADTAAAAAADIGVAVARDSLAGAVAVDNIVAVGNAVVAHSLDPEGVAGSHQAGRKADTNRGCSSCCAKIILTIRHRRGLSRTG